MPFSLIPNHCFLLTKRKDLWFSSQLACPAVLRKRMYGEEGNICRCSCHMTPEVTGLECDHLLSNQLSHVDQSTLVCVFWAKERRQGDRRSDGHVQGDGQIQKRALHSGECYMDNNIVWGMFSCVFHFNTLPWPLRRSRRDFTVSPCMLAL